MSILLEVFSLSGHYVVYRLRNFIFLMCCFAPTFLQAAPLDTYQSFIAGGDPADARRVGNNALLLRGTGTRNFYYLEVDPATGRIPVDAQFTPTQFASSFLFRQAYSVTPVTTAAYVQIAASTADEIYRFYIFDSSGSAMILATGGAGSEVDKLYIAPGGNTNGYELYVPAGTRLSLKALDTSATVGQVIITGVN
jgi:hypothetical protein